MKRVSSIFVQNSILLICFSACVFTTYGQNNIVPTRTVFGKKVRTENNNPNNRYIRCATTEYEQYLQEKNPNRLKKTQFEAWITPLISTYKKFRASSRTTATIITIPVVVHVIYNGEAVGVAPNITDAQVESQITVLNQDYRKMLGTPGYNSNPVGADIEIQFVLAKVDPNGNPTNGIDRVSLCEKSWSEDNIEREVKPSTIWDPTMYMNIWTVRFSDENLLGYAQFPDNSNLTGINSSNGVANTDGVISSYDVFGSAAHNDGSFLLSAPYDKGRTMTHEVGHWLGLLHIWGDGNGNEGANNPDCSASDYCSDTPQAGWEHYSCGTFDTCPLVSGNDMPENYMDYTDDVCMNIFTENQKDRIMTVLSNSPRRKSLKNSTRGNAITLFELDAEIILDKNCTKEICNSTSDETLLKITIYNRGTTTITTTTLTYQISGGAVVPYTFTKNIKANEFADFGITIASSSQNREITASIVTVNGTQDQRASNDTITESYDASQPPTIYAFNTFKFKLQQDYYGSEITWELRDGSNNLKYRGGPYTNTNSSHPANLITQNWTLEDNQCYTFTIKDSGSDGICCGTSGDGFYSITSSDEFSVIKSGSEFKESESVSFKTNTQSVSNFFNTRDIYLYPNPTKDVLNIVISSNFDLPDGYVIYSNLGQIVSRRTIERADDLIINTTNLSTGVYILNIEKQGKVRTFQFIKK